jgi:hypothetical protein
VAVPKIRERGFCHGQKTTKKTPNSIARRQPGLGEGQVLRLVDIMGGVRERQHDQRRPAAARPSAAAAARVDSNPNA